MPATYLMDSPSPIAERQKPLTARRVFFPNLNGIRFIAVLLVIMCHVEGEWARTGHLTFLPNAAEMGQQGVNLFFVLSGFLITYLLLAEKETYGRIQFTAFYARRIVRIWPLYYFVVVLGLFVLPHIEFFNTPIYTALVQEQLATKMVLYALILPNVVQGLYPPVPYLVQTWSIGVEEQFYIIWPILINYSQRYFRNFIILAGLVYVLCQLSWALTTPQRHVLPINELTTFIKNFLFFFRIQCMAIGGLFALILFRNWTRAIQFFSYRPLQIGVWILLAILLARGQTIPYIKHEVYSVLFGIVVLNLALDKSSIINLQHRVLDYLGRISYGLYMLHAIGIVVGFRIMAMSPGGDFAHHTALYGFVLAISITLATASYYGLELRFLKLKKQFIRIQSGS